MSEDIGDHPDWDEFITHKRAKQNRADFDAWWDHFCGVTDPLGPQTGAYYTCKEPAFAAWCARALVL